MYAHEVASFVHLPVGIENPNSITIGFVKFRGKPIEKARIPLGDLSRHVYIIGATGTGKSSLLINMIARPRGSLV